MHILATSCSSGAYVMVCQLVVSIPQNEIFREHCWVPVKAKKVMNFVYKTFTTVTATWPNSNSHSAQKQGVLSTGVKRMFIENMIGVDLIRSIIKTMLPSLFPVKYITPTCSETPAAWNWKHPWLRSERAIWLTMIDYFSNTKLLPSVLVWG